MAAHIIFTNVTKFDGFPHNFRLLALTSIEMDDQKRRVAMSVTIKDDGASTIQMLLEDLQVLIFNICDGFIPAERVDRQPGRIQDYVQKIVPRQSLDMFKSHFRLGRQTDTNVDN